MVNQPILSATMIGLFSQDNTLISQLQSIILHLTIIDSLEELNTIKVDILLIDDDINDFDNVLHELATYPIPTLLLINLIVRDLNIALQAGVTDYIPKPISHQILIHRLEQLNKSSNIPSREPSNHIYNQDDLLDKLINSVISTDKDYVITGWNKSAEALYGWRAEEVIGQRLRGLVPTIYVNSNRFDIAKTMARGEVWRGELIQSNKYGEKKHVLSSSSNIFDESGNIKGYVAITHDITDRQIIAHELQNINERLELIYDHLPIMLVSFDSNGKIIQVNQQTLEDTGYQLTDIIYHQFEEFLIERDVLNFRQKLQDYITSNVMLSSLPVQLICVDNQIIDIVLDVIPIMGERNQHFHLGILRNMTQQREIEKSLVNTEVEYQSILSSMSDLIFVFDAHGTYLKIPRTQASDYFVSPEILIGQTLHDVFSEKQANDFLTVINKVIETQSTQIYEYNLPIDDKVTYLSAVVNPIKGRDEVLWVTRNITQNKLSELAIIETEKRYRDLFDNANDMLLMVDLKTGQILDANKQTQHQLGYTYQEITQLKINQIEEPMQDAKSRIVTRTLAKTGHLIFEQNYFTKDNTLIPVETSTRIVDHKGHKVMLSFARNIKQRKSAMQAEAEERYFAEVLRDTISRLAQTLTMDDVLNVMMETVVKVVDSESVNIMLVEGDTANVVRKHGYIDISNHVETHIVSSLYTLNHMYTNKQGIIISDTQHDKNWINFSNDSWAKSYIGAPILLKNDVIGFINLDSSQTNFFTNKHIQRLQAFANQAAIAIENARLYEANQRYTEDLEARVKERTAELTQANLKLTEQIAKRHQAENKLAKESNLLRTIIDSLPVTVYVKNRQSQFTLTNQFPYLSIKEQPIIGKSDRDLLNDKENAQLRYNEEQQLMAQKETYVNEEYRIDVNGDERWIVVTKVPLSDEEGNVIGLVGVNQDITQIKLAERQIHQLLSSANCLLWSATVEYDGKSFDWEYAIENADSAYEFLPFDTATKTYTQAWQDSIPYDDQVLRETIANTYLQHNQQNYKLEYRCITNDGKEHWLNEDVQIRQATTNRWHLVGVSLDISDIKFAEFALRNAYEQMEQRVIDRTSELQTANQDLQQEIITRQQAEEAERRQRILAEALQDSITALNNTLNIDDVLDAVLNAMKVTIEHDAANIMLIEDDKLIIVRQRGYPSQLPEHIPLDSIRDVPVVYKDKKPIVISDTQQYELWDSYNEAHGEIYWVRSNVKIPIIYDDRVIGILMLDSREPNKFTIEHINVLQTFANQASIALENARLYQAEHQQRILAETLQESLKALNNTLNIDDVLDAVLDSIQQNVEHRAANVMLIEGNFLRIVRKRGYKADEADTIPLGKFQEVLTIIETKQPLIIADTLTYDKWVGREDDWIRSNIKIPIFKDDEVIGIINLDSAEPNQYTLNDIKLLQAFTNQASIALQNAQLYQQAQAEIVERQRAEDAERKQRIFAETIRDTAITLNQHLNSEDLYETIIQTVSQVIKVHDTISIIAINPDNMMGVVIKEQGYENHGGSIIGLEISFNNLKTKQRLLENRQPIHVIDTHDSDIWIHIEETSWIRSHISLPIYIQDEILALINLDSQYSHTFTDEHVNQLVVLSHQVAIALQNAKLVEQIQGYTHELESRVIQRTAELENERALLQLERSQLRAILDAMRDGVYFTDNTHQPIYINNALVELTGYTQEHWLSGRVFEDINRNISIDRNELWNTIERHLDVYRFFQNEGNLTRADGTIFTASLIRTEVRGIDNKRVGIVTVIRDISHDKQLEDQKSRFIAHAAHELRTPITNIKTRLFLMKHKPENIQDHMRIAESAANWLQTLVDNLFDHSRFERGIIQLELQEIILDDLINIIIETQSPEAQKKNINLIAESIDKPIIITADDSRLRQVITNLINNAVAYTPDGGTITVAVKQVQQDDTAIAVISVQDTGVGIGEEHIPYLFEPFYRATDDTKGTGLGLSISREIIEAHQGKIEVESIIGEGTTFYVSLPLLPKLENAEEV